MSAPAVVKQKPHHLGSCLGPVGVVAMGGLQEPPRLGVRRVQARRAPHDHDAAMLVDNAEVITGRQHLDRPRGRVPLPGGRFGEAPLLDGPQVSEPWVGHHGQQRPLVVLAIGRTADGAEEMVVGDLVVTLGDRCLPQHSHDSRRSGGGRAGQEIRTGRSGQAGETFAQIGHGFTGQARFVQGHAVGRPDDRVVTAGDEEFSPPRGQFVPGRGLRWHIAMGGQARGDAGKKGPSVVIPGGIG